MFNRIMIVMTIQIFNITNLQLKQVQDTYDGKNLVVIKLDLNLLSQGIFKSYYFIRAI